MRDIHSLTGSQKRQFDSLICFCSSAPQHHRRTKVLQIASWEEVMKISFSEFIWLLFYFLSLIRLKFNSRAETGIITNNYSPHYFNIRITSQCICLLQFTHYCINVKPALMFNFWYVLCQWLIYLPWSWSKSRVLINYSSCGMNLFKISLCFKWAIA